MAVLKMQLLIQSKLSLDTLQAAKRRKKQLKTSKNSFQKFFLVHSIKTRNALWFLSYFRNNLL